MSNEMLAMAKEALGMFAFLATELTILFIVISYLVGVLQLFITPEKIQSILSSKNGKGYVVAALLGAITPFCSCSTIPFLKGLLRARAGFGPMMVFLFGSPLLNPVIIGLFVITFGWQVALFYFLVAVVVSVVAGYTLEKLGFERYVKPEAYSKESTSSCAKPSCSEPKEVESSCATTSCGEPKAIEPTKKAQPNRWIKVWHATFKDFKQVFPYLMLGVAIGSFIYGFIPTELIAKYAGDGMWYAIPIAAIIGIPLYIRAEAVIPLSAALVKKGMALGSVMALIIGSAGASLTEVILLKSIFKNQMIAAFLFVIITMAIGAGFLYQAIF
ncbi:hypothetical protein A2I98_07440 [Pseudoalteromonas agarivorans]|uniref:Permease n=1 Tax=Pseudoalteromonas agarivorans TaxID=176102 RepID=A0ABR5VVH4_9GAMM|nr:permease [Pseudoalteromonas telluritireducens]KYL35360.1 hypothetical protein A2I98_07440 [Pseudoalteromonas telluritireducens]